MLFNSLQFVLFFAALWALLRVLPRRFEMRVLLVASLCFYGLWIPALLPLLLGLLAVNYVLVRRMVNSSRPGRYVASTVVITLAVLGVVKYGVFTASALAPFVPSAGHWAHRLSTVALPLGISFYSFEIISLAVDIRQRKLPCPSFDRYVLFVTFFPHLVAGPIMRGAELLPQFEQGGEVKLSRTRRGLWLFGVGLVKKAVLSDFLLVPFVAAVFDVPGANKGPSHLVAMYSFAFQIYFDFSGYSDMARGIACLLGFELPMNFEEPYLSRGPSEFWRSWHISLSRWLRDYLYVPLGGNRRGPVRTLVNLMITMLLGGLWHGAGLNFVIWGGLHGVLLVAYRFATKGQEASREASAVWGWSDVLRAILMFQLVCLLWIPFRTQNWHDTVAFVRGLGSGGYLGSWPVVPAAIVALCAGLHVAERAIRIRLPSFHLRLASAWWGPAFEGGILGVVLMGVVLCSGAGVQFIYFQF